MNFCFAGYGSIADVHAQAMKDEEDVVFHTVVGRLADSAAEFAEQHGFAHHMTDYEAAIGNPEIDAVVITTPSEMHYDQTMKALKAGKHVLCEIPLAMTFAECHELTQLAHQAGRALMVAHTMRFYRPYVIVKEMVERGELAHPSHSQPVVLLAAGERELARSHPELGRQPALAPRLPLRRPVDVDS